MNEYEAKQESRRERLLGAAEKAHAEADANRRRADSIAGVIPLGQPILVGHHSEVRHRRDLDRMHGAMGKAIDADKRAAELGRRADAVGSGGISSDDPEAVAKLRQKLAEMEERRERIKRVNRAYKKLVGAGASPAAAVGQLDVPDDEKMAIARSMALQPYHRAPYPPYVLSNLAGNMRRVRERIAELSAAGDEPAREPIRGDGYTIREDKDANRIRFEFDARPPKEVCRLLRGYGWRWSPTESAWLRHLNAAGRANAQLVATLIAEKRVPSV